MLNIAIYHIFLIHYMISMLQYIKIPTREDKYSSKFYVEYNHAKSLKLTNNSLSQM